MFTEYQNITDTWLDGEPPCEYGHDDDPCSGHVVALVRGCAQSGLVCDNARQDIEVRRRLFVCSHCKLPAADCWRIHPI